MGNIFARQVKDAISTFADEIDDVVLDRDGTITFQREDELQYVKLKDNYMLEYEGQNYNFTDFLSQKLANLHLFAKKIIQRDVKEEEDYYVDPTASLITVSSQSEDYALKILQNECDEPSWSGTRVAFVTADAGHGKSFLLRQFQRKQAQRYLNGSSKYLFWHIDLHGRDLVRLNEAIMSEIGEMRIRGIYYNTIITLIKNGLIVLGIDGFDELAAEKGGDVALGSLSNLVMELDGQGTLIAASRRTFFNTQDYILRTGIINRRISSGCEFDEIRLRNWTDDQCRDYLKFFYPNPTKILQDLKSILSSKETHPLIERPFLFTKLVSFASSDKISPYEFVSHGGEGNLDSINNIICAFVRREVTKWAQLQKDSGKPYLDYDQHMRLLADIANEMWLEQKDNLSVETIQFILAILYEVWGTDVTHRPIINRFVESHALLAISGMGDRFRRFDHDEFRNFFLALALERLLKEAISTNNFTSVSSFLKVAQLPDTVSQYLAIQLTKEESNAVICGLLTMEYNDWKATYAQPNIGTLLPFLFDKVQQDNYVIVDHKINFSSLVFENKSIRNVCFRDCSFINISFCHTKLYNIKFEACSFTDIRFNANSGNVFCDVIIDENCQLNMITIIKSEKDSYSEYSPYNINGLLAKQGIKRNLQETVVKTPVSEIKNPEFRKAVKRFLNKYIKATSQYEINILEDPIYNGGKQDVILTEIIPMLLKYNIIEEVSTTNSKLQNSKAWRLKGCNVSDVYKAEENVQSTIYGFWEEVHNHE